jgi:hypothetical protein
VRRATAIASLLPLALLAGCGDSEDHEQHDLTLTSPSIEVEVVDSNDDGRVPGDSSTSRRPASSPH